MPALSVELWLVMFSGSLSLAYFLRLARSFFNHSGSGDIRTYALLTTLDSFNGRLGKAACFWLLLDALGCSSSESSITMTSVVVLGPKLELKAATGSFVDVTSSEEFFGNVEAEGVVCAKGMPADC